MYQIKNNYLLLIILMISSTSIFAQKGSISGTVIDQSINQAIPFANVVVKEKNSSKIIKGDVTSDLGNFKLNGLEYGSYTLEVSFIGFNKNTIKNILISKATKNIKLGKILLVPVSENLEEVTVKSTTKTSTTKIDRRTYNTNDFETAKGGNAADLLSKLPSVSLDGNGNISVRGTNDFMVYLNGKPTQVDPTTLLNQIAANTINKIDIITVPTAKYDAQGKGGIINISTKTIGEEGLTITANGLLGGAPWANITDKYSGHKLNDDRYAGGVNLLYNTKKMSFYGGFNYNKKNVNGMRRGRAKVLVKDIIQGEYFHMDASGERPEWYEYYSANAGVDYQLSDKEKVSLSYFYGNRNAGRAAYYVYNNYGLTPGSDIIGEENWVYNPNVDNRYGKYNTINLDYNIDLNKNSNLNWSGSYESSNLSRALTNENYNYDPFTDITSDLEQEYSLSDNTPLKGFRTALDFKNKTNTDGILNAGIQINHVNIAGDFNFSNSLILEKNLNNAIDLTRNVYAGYIDYSGKTDNLDFIVGLRTEYGDQVMNVENTDYLTLFNNTGQSKYEQKRLDLFPSAHLKFHLNDNNNILFAASRRINRPSVTNLAPFLYRRHLEVYVVGDPELEAEYLNNAELSYETKLGKNNVTLTGFFRGTDNAVFRVNTTTTAIENADVFDILQENVLIRSYTNAGNSIALGGEVNSNIYINSFTKLFLGASLYNFNIDGEVFGYKVNNSSTNWSLKSNLNLDITNQLKCNLDYNFRSRTVTSQGSNDPFSLTNIAFNYTPKNLKGWQFSLRGLDLFGSNIQGLDTNAFNSAQEQIFYQETEYVRNGQIVELGITYSLNTKKNIKKDKAFEGNKHFK